MFFPRRLLAKFYLFYRAAFLKKPSARKITQIHTTKHFEVPKFGLQCTLKPICMWKTTFYKGSRQLTGGRTRNFPSVHHPWTNTLKVLCSHLNHAHISLCITLSKHGPKYELEDFLTQHFTWKILYRGKSTLGTVRTYNFPSALHNMPFESEIPGKGWKIQT